MPVSKDNFDHLILTLVITYKILSMQKRVNSFLASLEVI